MRRRTWRCGAAASIAALILLPLASAPAAEPEAGVRFLHHDHRTKGAGWHVEINVSRRDRAVMRILVLYDQRCDETIAVERIRLTPAGTLEASRSFEATDHDGAEQGGRWEIRARFPSKHRVEGWFTISEPGCEVRHDFSATHGGHSGAGGHGHGATSDPFDYPDIEGATPAQRAAASGLLRRVRSVAARRFPTIATARAEGFNRYMVRDKVPEPGVFHLWSRAYNGDAHVLDADRPESLVYWKPTQPGAEPVLLAFMLRLPPGPRPKFAGTIPSYHTHKKGGDMMTHVWLADDLRGAYANCLPVPELERAVHAFDFEDIRYDGHESQPCAQTTG
jgi:hypothetical protein